MFSIQKGIDSFRIFKLFSTTPNQIKTWPGVYKTFFMVNPAEHEILNAHKYENIKKFSFFQAQISLECYFFQLISVKVPTVVGILTLMSRKNFMLSRVEHEIFFITLGHAFHSVLMHLLSFKLIIPCLFHYKMGFSPL